MTNSGALTKAQSETATDPVCGMSVVPGETKLVSLHNGHSYWFCAENCREAFETNPGKYLEPKSSKRQGWFKRYLRRIAKTNEKEFGCSGPKCQ